MNVGKELAAMRRMSASDLRSRYAEVFGETTNTHHKEWLIKRIIYRMQALAERSVGTRPPTGRRVGQRGLAPSDRIPTA
jgi:hypothetical protein